MNSIVQQKMFKKIQVKLMAEIYMLYEPKKENILVIKIYKTK